MSKNLILDKLEDVKRRFEDIGRQLTMADVMENMKKYIQLNKEYKELNPVIEAYNEYKNTLSNIESAREMLSFEKDEEMREMAKTELDDLTEKVGRWRKNLKYSFCLLTLRMPKMRYLRYVRAPAVMKPVFLQGIFSGYIPGFANRRAENGNHFNYRGNCRRI
jgi:hypothetical protein